MKKINRTLIVFAIVLVMLITGIITILNVLRKDKNTVNPNETGKTIIDAKELWDEKYWPKEVIAKEVESAPIPIGFDYVTGSIDTGIIIQKVNSSDYLLWIPYDDSIIDDKEVQEYYKDCDTISIDSKQEDSIKQYGGFYIVMDDTYNYQQLKDIDNNTYSELYGMATEKYKYNDVLSSGLITRNQIQQVNSYLSKISTNLSKLTSSNKTATIDNLTKITGENVIKTENKSYPQVKAGIVTAYPEIYTKLENEGIATVQTYEGENIIIPKGFKVSITEGNKLDRYDKSKVIKIEDENNSKLRYVWIPVNTEIGASSLSKAKEELETYYVEAKKEMQYYNAYDDANNELINSVDAYGGFFMAESELRYIDKDNTRTIANTAAGMVPDEKYGWGQVNEGEYYRGTEVETIEKAKEISEQINNNQTSVKSHLTTGTEWDAMILWLIKSGAITGEQAVSDSSTAPGAKYSGTYNSTLNNADIQGTNGLYGICGNLIEFTTEKMNVDSKDNIVTRGGSYTYTGKQYSAASRMLLASNDLKWPDVGFRNCLYINANLDELQQNKYTYVALGDSIAYGYLVEKEDRYSNLLNTSLYNNYTNVKYTNLAVTGWKASDLLNAITNSSYSETRSDADVKNATNDTYVSAIKDADLITVSIGSNELLSVVTSKLAEIFGIDKGKLTNDSIQAKIQEIVKSGDVSKIQTMISELKNAYNELGSNLSNGVESYKQSWKSIVSKIEEINPDVTIVATEFYNPYADVTDIKIDYNGSEITFADFTEMYIKQMNEILVSESNNESNYKIAKIHDDFKQGSGLTNVEFKFDTSGMIENIISLGKNSNSISDYISVNVDPHPNAKGHKKIYERINEALGNTVAEEQTQAEKGNTTDTVDAIKWSGEIANGFASGDGSNYENAYIVETPEQLAYLAQEVNNGNEFTDKYIRIVNSFDMQGINWTPIGGFGTQEQEGEAAETGNAFRGFLDGNNNEIVNLTVEQTEEYRQNVGLVGCLGAGGQISNINIVNGNILGWETVGGIVGYSKYGYIENCKFSGTVYSKYSSYYSGYSEEEEFQDGSGALAGGIVGHLDAGTIKECINEGNITCEFQYVGGITGSIDNANVLDCINRGTIQSKYISDIADGDEIYRNAAGMIAGGIGGYQGNGTIEGCINEGTVIAENQAAGGIIGFQENGVISTCVNSGTITAKQNSGDIIGTKYNQE